MNILEVRSEVIDLKLAGQVPLLHPEGFLQLKLHPSGDLKLHVWHPDLPRRADPDTLHDHVWDLRSHVLVGELVNENRHLEIHPRGDWELYGVVSDGRQSDSTEGAGGKYLARLGVLARAGDPQVMSTKAGGNYFVTSRVFHRSKPLGPTATVMRKFNRLENQEPLVAAKVGQTPDNLEHLIDVEGSWIVIEEVLGL